MMFLFYLCARQSRLISRIFISHLRRNLMPAVCFKLAPDINTLSGRADISDFQQPSPVETGQPGNDIARRSQLQDSNALSR
jgi:hypothetical protein